MSTPVVPSKTALGQDEVRHRTHGLSQRHRTVLLLVDGRRSLGEVLNLANQAGSAIGHFEDLVRLGLVDVPVQAAALPAEVPVQAVDVPQMTSVEMVVPSEPLDDEAGELLAQETPPPVQVAQPEPAQAVPALQPVPPPVEPLSPIEPPGPIEPLVTLDALLCVQPKSREEEPALERARRQLLELLRLDSPRFVSRLTSRVRDAETTTQLIDLVWEIERQLGVMKRSRPGQLCLEQARDLLGLGNTQVAEDTQPGRLG